MAPKRSLAGQSSKSPAKSKKAKIQTNGLASFGFSPQKPATKEEREVVVIEDSDDDDGDGEKAFRNDLELAKKLSLGVPLESEAEGSSGGLCGVASGKRLGFG